MSVAFPANLAWDKLLSSDRHRLGAQSRKHKHNLIGGYSRKNRLNHRDYEGHSTEMKANSRDSKQKESAHLVCLTNPTS